MNQDPWFGAYRTAEIARGMFCLLVGCVTVVAGVVACAAFLLGCGVEDGPGDCPTVLELTSDTVGLGCTLEDPCCPDGFVFVGMDGGAIVCLEER